MASLDRQRTVVEFESGGGRIPAWDAGEPSQRADQLGNGTTGCGDALQESLATLPERSNSSWMSKRERVGLDGDCWYSREVGVASPIGRELDAFTSLLACYLPNVSYTGAEEWTFNRAPALGLPGFKRRRPGYLRVVNRGSVGSVI